RSSIRVIPGVPAGPREFCRGWWWQPSAFSRPKNLSLMADQLQDSLSSKSDQFHQRRIAKGIPLGGPLEFNELASIGHHDIEIHIGGGVFAVIEIEHGNPADDSNTHGGD